MDEVLSRYEPLLDDYEAFRAACDRPLPHLVRVNTLKTSVDRAVEALREEGIGVERRDWHDALLELDTDTPGNTWPYFLGWLHGQEEVSAIPTTVLDPDPDDCVLDACAAPGSKTGQLAAAMADRGRILANDANLGRLAPLRSNMERLGVTNVAVTNRDARHLSLSEWEFDAVDATLVDAPCSGEGTVRKNPASLSDWSEGFLEDVATLQRDILKRAIRLTKPGGTVVYSTCTFAPEENEAVLDAVLDSEDCRLRAFDLPLPSDPGVTEWRGATYDETVRRAKRIWPHHSDTGGFFCANVEVTR
jgi:NOL1/NOP2/sun family putative RNA methylase